MRITTIAFRLAWLSVALTLGAVLGSAPASLAGGGPAVFCQPTNPQPAQPLEMNTVAVQGLAKTIAMEKELFDCQDDSGQIVRFIRDAVTFIELIVSDTGADIVTVARRVLVTYCDKHLVGVAGVKCQPSSLPLGPVVANPLLNCRPPDPAGVVRTPADPVEMNSVRLGDFIRTIKVQKEIFFCDQDIADVYIFVELLEKRNAAGTSYDHFATRFFGIICKKSPSEGRIRSCNRFATS